MDLHEAKGAAILIGVPLVPGAIQRPGNFLVCNEAGDEPGTSQVPRSALFRADLSTGVKTPIPERLRHGRMAPQGSHCDGR